MTAPAFAPLTDREQEIAYKSDILNKVAEALNPDLWNNKDKLSNGALDIVRHSARLKARDIMRAIAPFIKPWREVALPIDDGDGQGDASHPANLGSTIKPPKGKARKK